ncbi:DNAH1, partial [Symbiodinium necroappetens]
LAFAGAQCCFDEPSRINIEVLSVIAQQLRVPFGDWETYFVEKKHDHERSCNGPFEATLTGWVMKPTFNVFITLNPGHLHLITSLVKLKVLRHGAWAFEVSCCSADAHPEAVMVPDYARFGFGFAEAKILMEEDGRGPQSESLAVSLSPDLVRCCLFAIDGGPPAPGGSQGDQGMANAPDVPCGPARFA